MRLITTALGTAAALLGLGLFAVTARAEGRIQVTCYTTYDTDYFYMAAVVKKPNLAGKQAVPFGDPLSDDAVAVFLQTEEGTVGSQRAAHSVEMAVSAAGGAQLYRGADAAPLKGFQDILAMPDGRRVPFKYAVTLQGRLNQPGGDNTGYTVEMAVPWLELGGVPQVGQRMRFDVVAYSAASGSPSLLSLVGAVKSPGDVQNPSLWNEIVFVDAPVKNVAGAPNAQVCARVFSAKPLIDGVVNEGEWNTLTAFGFGVSSTGGTTATGTATFATSRTRPAVTLRKASPPILPTPPKSAMLPTRTPQAVPRLVFTLYHYDYQNDTRKEAPLASVRRQAGASLLATHPMDGAGPWMTYDSVGWHRTQMENLRSAGIDVALPVYRADVYSKQRYSQRGLTTLVGALRSLRDSNRDYPLIGLYLDTASLTDSHGAKPDLHDPAAQAQLYAAIKDFYLQIPFAYRLAIPLSEKNGGGTANLVVLSSAAAFSGFDGTFVDYCRRRFAADFGSDLLILGGSDFKSGAPLDGYVDDTHGRGFQMDDSGWIKPADIGVGYDETVCDPHAATSTTPPIRSRADGDTYRGEWKQALAKKAEWVFVDGWNDYADGSEIAPTDENGLIYSDLTRLFTRAFAGTGEMRASFVSNTIPTVGPQNAAYAVSVRVQNAGTILWTPDTFALVYRWQRKDGSPIGGDHVTRLPGPILPGQAVSVSFSVPMPQEPGDDTLAVEVAQINKKGEATTLFSRLGSPPLLSSFRVVAANDPALAPYAASVVRVDLPTTLETGGTYSANVTLRNEGSATWKKAENSRISARVWRYVSPINSTGETERDEPIDMADAGVALPDDVAPGQEVTVNIPLTFSAADGSPLIAWSQSDNWTYLLRWEYSTGVKEAQGAVTAPEAFALVDTDVGAEFITDRTPSEMPGDHRIPVKLGLRNVGPQTWRKDVTRVGYHWYYLDGTEAVWQDETTPITQDVEPGGEAPEMLAWITPPPDDGAYWLVWDVLEGDRWASTLPSVRAYETRVHRVEVVHGHLTFVDLSKAFNLAGIADDTDRANGDFDGGGRSLPSELTPPFADGEIAPATLWLPSRGVGLDSSRHISFRWGPKGPKEKNVVQCVGQHLPVGDPHKPQVYKVVHLLAAATHTDTSGAITLRFADGTEQFISFPFSAWNAAPTRGEEVAWICRYSRTRSGDAFNKPAYLFHYTIRVTEPKKLAEILLPNQPAIKILAITLEK